MLNVNDDNVMDFISLQYDAGKSKDIQVLCSYDQILTLFDRIRHQWTEVGQVEPYHSVLSDEKYNMNNFSAHEIEFHETGKFALSALNSVCLKNDVDCPNGSIFELGCGVGRSTQYFSPAFERVYAWDISRGNLSECKKNLEARGVFNVNLRLVDQVSDYSDVPAHDVFFSEIVIQHNPPPLQYFLLDKVLSKLNPGGVFFFQTITHHRTYSFNVNDYLNWQHNQSFEMHALPMRWVNRVIRKNGLVLMDVIKRCTY